MADSQPGTVSSFNPSVSLTGFSAGARDRLMFNEDQLVLAKLQQPRPVFAHARSRAANGTYTEFNSYTNLSGEFVYIDGSFQALSTSGVPTSDVHQIVIGFDQQVLTSTIKFWSRGFVDTSLLAVEYSFDNITWFAAGTVTWVQFFDDTIEVFPGDSPPTGEFRYTGTLASAITARYWKIRGDIQTTYTSKTGTSPSETITVASTTGFPSSGSAYATKTSSSDIAITYTGKSATTLTGSTVSPDTLSSGYVIFTLYAFGNNVTEVQIIPSSAPILQHWNSDGTQAVTVGVEGEDYYDIAYDKNDDVYYAIRFNTELGGGTITPDDNFNSGSTSSFDTTRWIESTINSYFDRNTASGTLDLRSNGGVGQLYGNYGVDGNFICNIDLVALVQLASVSGYFAVESKEYSTGNQYLLSCIKGPYTPPSLFTGQWGAAVISYNDTVGGAAQLQDFHINPGKFDFGFGSGSVQYDLAYNTTTNRYSVSASGIIWPDATPGVPYSLDSATFTVSNLTTPANGQGFSVVARCAQSSIVNSTSASGIRLQLERNGTNGYARYKESEDVGFTTLLTHNIPTIRLRPQLYGSGVGGAVNIGADNFATAGTIFFDTPVFSVVTVNKDGELVQLSGISDTDGYAIKRLDIIRDANATYNQYLTPKIGIATNGAAEGAGGALFIKVDETLYKYAKTALPLDLETGSLAALETEGEIPSSNITAFSYNGYTQAGLSYIEFDEDLGGVYLKTIGTTDLLAKTKRAKLDVASISFPFGWNVSDLSTLYYVSSTSLRVYDLNETKAGFVVVTSDKQVLSAGTAETAVITAQVINVYGEPKSNKTVTFSVSAGDGAISPTTGCSDVNGEETTTYTVGSAVGTASITVSVSNTSCV
jgi:hypothetical protein